jgi:hypothetical protein
MAKTTTIINHLTGMNSDTISVVGTTGQIQLIKHETNMEDINEFYDTEEAANTEALSWT